jgi:hypothetical protein
MIARNHRQATLLRLTSLALAMTMTAGVQLVAAPADRPPLRGLEEVDHAQVENLKTEDRGQKTAIRAPSSVIRHPLSW